MCTGEDMLKQNINSCIQHQKEPSDDKCQVNYYNFLSFNVAI